MFFLMDSEAGEDGAYGPNPTVFVISKLLSKITK